MEKFLEVLGNFPHTSRCPVTPGELLIVLTFLNHAFEHVDCIEQSDKVARSLLHESIQLVANEY